MTTLVVVHITSSNKRRFLHVGSVAPDPKERLPQIDSAVRSPYPEGEEMGGQERMAMSQLRFCSTNSASLLSIRSMSRLSWAGLSVLYCRVRAAFCPGDR